MMSCPPDESLCPSKANEDLDQTDSLQLILLVFYNDVTS